MKSRIKVWVIALAIALGLAQVAKIQEAKNIEPEEITINAPKAMHESFTITLEALKLDKKYELKFTNSESVNFSVTTKKSNTNELIAYSPIVAVFNPDEELYETYIKQGIFVPSETEKDAYDFDFQKVMKDIINNPNSTYKVYYPDSSFGDWNVFYTFLLYTANGECYPSEGTNMAQTKELVDVFLNSKNTESIGTEALDKISGYSKSSVYFMSLADLGYICEQRDIPCRVMYPKTIVSYNYYANFDEVGKKLYDMLDDECFNIFAVYNSNVGYNNLRGYGNYYIAQSSPEDVSIYYYNRDIRKNQMIKLRTNFNAVEVPEQTAEIKEDNNVS